MTWLIAAAAIAAAVCAVPGTIELAVLTLANLRPARKGLRPAPEGFKLAVVIPAHDEEGAIARAVGSIRDADRSGLVVTVTVVADNCTDHTAALAAAAGARVIERIDPDRRGKGFALDLAFRQLLSEGVDAVLVVDADTVVDRQLLGEAAAAFAAGADAVQARYLVRNADDSARTRLMQLALMAFNVARPRGRDALGLSAGINGNGFGVSRATLLSVGYNAASVVEDLEYHLQLVRAGKRVWFLDRAAVRADMPSGHRAAADQRSRWEGGRARLAREVAPQLLGEVLRGQWRLWEPLLDLLLPPLGLFVAVLAALVAVPFAPTRLFGLAGLSVVAAHVAVAIRVGGGGWSELKTLALAPAYVVWKIAMLGRIRRSSRRHAEWVRTPRESVERSRP